MARAVRPRFVPVPYQDAAESGRLILRDGATASVRLARPDDRQALQDFFQRLSAEARRQRFFSATNPPPELAARLCDNSNPRAGLTLVVTRGGDQEHYIIATGSYLAKDEHTAEVAFAVDDAFQGKGLGTLLLERLALLAVRHGCRRFWAVTHADNQAMRDVFRDSGFEVHEQADHGEIDVDLSVVPTQASVARVETRDRIATVASLRPFFQPHAVAVVGASREPAGIGHRVLQAIVSGGYRGHVYPVNPSAAAVAGMRAYPSVRDLPEPVDLAVLVVPRQAVLGVVDDCAARGVRALLVITAGFAEVDAQGRELQRQLLEKVRGHGMRMIGPNCLGLMNADPAVRLNATFAPALPPHGRVALSSQSGALGLAILTAAHRLSLGLSSFVSVGNKADVSGNDLLQYWEEDPGTDVILLYLESFGNPRRFARIARRVSQRKPIVAIKSGRTAAGGRAAASHTAALATSDTAVDALFQQTGVIRAQTLEEMFDLAALLGTQPLPPGRRVGIITNAGGPGILCADRCEAGGLVVPELSAAVKLHLAAFLPSAASAANPVDLIASATAEQYRRAIETVLSCGEVDALVVIYIPVGLVETEAIAGAMREAVAAARSNGAAGRPVVLCWMSEQARIHLEVGQERVPCYAFPETPAHVLSKAATYAEWRSRPPGIIPDFDDLDLESARRACDDALATHETAWLSADQTRTVLSAMGLPLAAGGTARTDDEAVDLAQRLGFPVAIKLAARAIVHKTEAGGVHLDLPDAAAVRRAIEGMRRRLAAAGRLDAMEGVVVQPMVSGGVEVMVGATQDPRFGPLIAFGLGGIHVEILGDVCFRVAPLSDRDAEEMIRSIRGYRLLQGYRGQGPVDLDAVRELLLRVSRLVEELPRIRQLDLNPIFALPPGQGCRIVDARIQVGIPASAG